MCLAWRLIRADAVAFLVALTAGSAFALRAEAGDTMSRAQYNWVMYCQGCHGVDAQGTPGGAPSLVGNVARFLRLPAGRAYLGRVPGVAFVALSDAELAQLLNWVVRRFDEAHVPTTFAPYLEGEIRALRREPLISSASRERERLLRLLVREGNATPEGRAN